MSCPQGFVVRHVAIEGRIQSCTKKINQKNANTFNLFFTFFIINQSSDELFHILSNLQPNLNPKLKFQNCDNNVFSSLSFLIIVTLSQLTRMLTAFFYSINYQTILIRWFLIRWQHYTILITFLSNKFTVGIHFRL